MATHQRHHTGPDAIIGAGLQGIASRWAAKNGWAGPADGPERETALAELRDRATVGGRLRADLLARAAGVCLGASRLDRIQARLDEGKAVLLLAVLDGAEAETVERVAKETYDRLSTATVRPFRFR